MMKRCISLVLLVGSIDAVLVVEDRDSVVGADAVAEEGADDDCCNCPGLDVEKVQAVEKLVRDALESVVPGKWFLEDGTLIGALRYGGNVHKFKSGKVNLGDIDMDLAVIAKEEDVPDIESTLDEKFPAGWTKGSLDRRITDTRLAARGCKGKGEKYHFSIRWIYEKSDGELGLEKGDNPEVENIHPAERFDFLKVDGQPSLKDHLLPLTKVKWGGGDGWAPKNPVAHLALVNNEEYGANGKWKKLEFPDKMSPFCSCPVDDDVKDEVKKEVKALHDAGYASFYGLDSDETQASINKIVEAYQNGKR